MPHFLDDVETKLTAGKAAILAEIEESWTTPADTRLHRLGGIVFRRLKSEVVEDQLLREAAAFEAEMKSLEDDLKRGIADDKAAIQRDIDQVQKQIKVIQDQAKARLDQARVETEAKITALKQQAKEGTDRAKLRIEKRMAKVKAEHEVRSKKLNEAWRLTKEALAL